MHRCISCDLVDKKRILIIPDELDALVYVIDPKSYEILYINKHGESFWGNIIGKKCWESIRGESGVCDVCDNKELLSKPNNAIYHKQEFYNRYLDKWLDSRSCIIDWYDGRKIRLGIAIDITERKEYEKKLEEQEEELRHSKQQLEDIINFLPDATFAIDKEGKVVAWNKAIEKMTGVKAESMLGKGNYEYAIPFYGVRRPMLVDLVWNYDQEIADRYKTLTYDKSSKTFRVEKFFLRDKGKYMSGQSCSFIRWEGEHSGRDRIYPRYYRSQRSRNSIKISSGT